MANEFYYCLDLSIVHESFDPRVITEAFTHLRSQLETTAGCDLQLRDGKPFNTGKKAFRSSWRAQLHDESRVFSGDHPISDVISEQLDRLIAHRHLFHEITKRGYATMVIGVFGITNYSACVLSAAMLKQCGDLGIDIELNYYTSTEHAKPADQSSIERA